MKAIVATVPAAGAMLQAWRLKVAVARVGARGLRRLARSRATTRAREDRCSFSGDSTGVGVGAERAADSIAGLVAAEFEDVRVVNVARSGAQLADACAMALAVRDAAASRFDVALLHVGGNDVAARHRNPAPARDVSGCSLPSCAPLARHTVWLGRRQRRPVADLPAAAVMWWLTRQGRRANAVFRFGGARAGIDYVEFFAERRQRICSRVTCNAGTPPTAFHPSSRS
jgi:lysophospholipase L1-like esterase